MLQLCGSASRRLNNVDDDFTRVVCQRGNGAPVRQR
ncbi:protein of unknown function [Microbacterium sp. Nx66]|nr:protein of unknown function [Microbacterium sp. Nx66]